MRDDVVLASWPLQMVRPDVSAVDELARLQLGAHRAGCSIRLRGACDELIELLDLAGLGEVIAGAEASVVEVGGQTEGGEQVGVEEGVEPGDAIP
jgi:hypothetical protein